MVPVFSHIPFFNVGTLLFQKAIYFNWVMSYFFLTQCILVTFLKSFRDNCHAQLLIKSIQVLWSQINLMTFMSRTNLNHFHTYKARKKNPTNPMLEIIYINTRFNHKCFRKTTCMCRQTSMQQTGRGISLTDFREIMFVKWIILVNSFFLTHANITCGC